MYPILSEPKMLTACGHGIACVNIGPTGDKGKSWADRFIACLIACLTQCTYVDNPSVVTLYTYRPTGPMGSKYAAGPSSLPLVNVGLLYLVPCICYSAPLTNYERLTVMENYWYWQYQVPV